MVASIMNGFAAFIDFLGELHKVAMPAHTAGINAGFLLGKLCTSLMCSLSCTLKNS